MEALRVAASALGVDWPDGATVGQVLAGRRRRRTARGAAFVDQAAELMRGAGYTAFDGEPPGRAGHGAVAARTPTSPRRCAASPTGTPPRSASPCTPAREVPDWAAAALPKLPEVMSATDRKASAAERGAVDLVEATVLAGRVGELFAAAVLDTDEQRPLATIAVTDPAVRARCDGRLTAGTRIQARLTTADVAKRQVRFTAV